MDQRFDTLWSEQLEPWLLALETERKKAVRETYIFGIPGVLLIIGGVIATIAMDQPLAFFAAFVGGFGLLWLGNRRLGHVRDVVKAKLNSQIAEACGLNYSLTPEEPHRFAQFRSLGLLPSYNRRSFEDHFSGKILDCDFDLYEAKLEQKRRSKNRTYYVTVFRGVLIRINFPRKVEGVTVITRDQGWFNGLTALGRSFGSNKLERIGLVDPKFEDAFEVYGSDQVLARYMLTPTFMEQLLELELSLKGKKIRAAFDQDLGQGELLVAVETGDLFEAGSMFKPLADRGRIRTIIEEINLITRIVGTLVERPGARMDDAEDTKD